MNQETLIQKLKEDLAQGRVVIVAGTGVSIAACGNQKIEGHPVAGWVGLLQHGLEYCRHLGLADNEDAELLGNQIRSNRVNYLISAAQEISKRLQSRSPGTYRGWLKNTIGKLEPKHREILDALTRLPGVLATLNYDGLIEQASHRKAVTWQREEKVQEVLRREITDAVIHIHGWFDEPESVVLGWMSYEQVASDAHTKAVLQLFTIDRTLLFVGCGGTVNDPNFSRLFDWAKDALKDIPPRHVLLCREEEFQTVRADLASAPWLLPLIYGKDYEELAPFLRSLALPGPALETVDHDRYLDLAVFPEDEAVPEGALQQLWGLDVIKTRQCVDRLVTRSLASVRQRVDGVMLLNLNDLQNEYVRTQREQELPQLHERLLAAYAAKCWERGRSGHLRLGASDRRTGRLFPQNMASYGCTAPWHLGPNDGYFFQRLPWHIAQAGRLAELRNLLLDFSWLLAKLRVAKVQALVADCDLLPDDQQIAFVQNALQLSTPALVRDPDQLPGHLAGRLRGFTEAGVNALVECAAQAKLEHPWLCPQTTASLEPPGPRITTLIGHTDEVRSVAALPDGIHILSGSDDTCVVLWNTRTGESFFLRGHTAGVTAVAVVQPRERALSGSKDKTLVLWDLKTRSAIQRFEGHSEAITSVAVVPDGQRAVSGSDDKTLILWDLGTGVPLRRLEGHAEAVTCVTVLPDGDRALSGSKDNSLILWNLRTGKFIRRLEGHGHWVNVVSLMPDGTRALSGSYDYRLILWDLETGKSLREFQQGQPAVAVAVVPDGSRALVGYDNDATIVLRDLQTGHVLIPFKSHTHAITAIALLPDGTHAVSASKDTSVILWDIRREHRRPPWHHSSVGAVAALPNGRSVLSGGVSDTPFDGILRLWDLETGKICDRTGGQGVTTLAVSPDGTRALCGEVFGALEVLNPKSALPLARLYPAGEHLNVYAKTAAFLAGSTRALAGYTDGTLILWNLETFQEIGRFRGNACCISRVAVLPDNTRALIGYVDGTLILYDLGRGQKVRDFEVHRMMADIVRVRYGNEEVGAISGSAALPDGRRVLSGSLIGYIVLWDLVVACI